MFEYFVIYDFSIFFCLKFRRLLHYKLQACFVRNRLTSLAEESTGTFIAILLMLFKPQLLVYFIAYWLLLDARASHLLLLCFSLMWKVIFIIH